MKKRYSNATIEAYEGKRKYRWAINMFVISLFLSLFFGIISQAVLTNMGIIISILVICMFIFLSVIFDMIGIAVASADVKMFEIWQKENVKGSSVGFKICENSEKVCSFCGDVVGDICSTLCGAGGTCMVVAFTKNITNGSLAILISISVSALIAGWTVFCKALMKEYALKNSNKIILKLGKLLEKTLFKEKNKKRLKNR